MAVPPSFGSLNVNVIAPFPGVADGCSSWSGTVCGIAAPDGELGGPSPSALVAVTVHVYVLPFVSPPTVTGDATCVADPAVPPFPDAHAALYPVIALPPSNGAAKVNAI
jgi:hypothetical protein